MRCVRVARVIKPREKVVQRSLCGAVCRVGVGFYDSFQRFGGGGGGGVGVVGQLEQLISGGFRKVVKPSLVDLGLSVGFAHCQEGWVEQEERSLRRAR